MDQYNAWNSLPRTLTIVLMCARDRDRESEPFKEIKIFYLNLESFNFFMTSFRYFLEIFQSLIVNECSVINRMFNSLMKCSIITDIRLFEWNSLPRTLSIVLMCARDRDRESEPFKKIEIFYLNLESFNFFMTIFRYFSEIFQSLIVNECSIINRMFNSLIKCSIITDIRLSEWNSLPRTLS